MDKLDEYWEMINDDERLRTRRFTKMNNVSLSIDERMLILINREAKERGKSWSVIVNYLLWSGYYANRGEFRPPRERTGIFE